MPKLSLAIAPTVEHTVELKPTVQVKLRKEFHTYAAKAKQVKKLREDIGTVKNNIEDILSEVNESKLTFEGFTAAIVGGERKQFDKKKFVKLGGDLALYNKCLVPKPVKASVRVYVPGEADEGEDD